jgi:UDP-N-acetylglucosamine 2-epimerase (non-hydrolysing)
MKILIVAGARPNFPKIAPIIKEIQKKKKIHYYLVHTGQHYDKNMSNSFFEQLGIPEPNINLEIHGGSHTEQTAKIMLGFEKIVIKEKPDYVLVVGDVNSTVAAALVAKKENIKLIHVEAGLRSFDERMPEEINRVIVDRISDLLFVTEQSGIDNLKKEGVSEHRIKFVGNVMIDTLAKNIESVKNFKQNIIDDSKSHCVVTLHRPSNVDNKEQLENILNIFVELQDRIKIVWPIHPRLKLRVKEFGLEKVFSKLDKIIFTEPLDYKTFMRLVYTSKFILTDSGGIQEETTGLKIPCLTLRTSTERPVTITEGTNTLIANDFELLRKKIEEILSDKYKKGIIPKYWDGKASERIVKKIKKDYDGGKK